jgi:hypothetical protein
LGSGIWDEHPRTFFRELRKIETFFRVKILKLFDGDLGPGMEEIRIRDPGWKKIRIRDGINSDPGSGISVPDPQHCLFFLGLLEGFLSSRRRSLESSILNIRLFKT